MRSANYEVLVVWMAAVGLAVLAVGNSLIYMVLGLDRRSVKDGQRSDKRCQEGKLVLTLLIAERGADDWPTPEDAEVKIYVFNPPRLHYLTSHQAQTQASSANHSNHTDRTSTCLHIFHRTTTSKL